MTGTWRSALWEPMNAATVTGLLVSLLARESGATFGFTSLVTLLPDADLGLVILTNATGEAGRLTNAVQLRLL